MLLLNAGWPRGIQNTGNAKLCTALQEMQLELQESKALLIKEREAAKKAAEQFPITQEVPVIDNELVNKLTAENEMLKVKLLYIAICF